MTKKSKTTSEMLSLPLFFFRCLLVDEVDVALSLSSRDVAALPRTSSDQLRDLVRRRFVARVGRARLARERRHCTSSTRDSLQLMGTYISWQSTEKEKQNHTKTNKPIEIIDLLARCAKNSLLMNLRRQMP